MLLLEPITTLGASFMLASALAPSRALTAPNPLSDSVTHFDDDEDD